MHLHADQIVVNNRVFFIQVLLNVIRKKMCDEIRLVRYDLGETPWGFRITGGRDFGTPLLVVKVVGGSIAELAGVQVGDLVRGINYVPTNEFTHLDAQRAILESGDTLILNLLKGGEYELLEPEPVPLLPVPTIPVIDIQSPEDKEVEEIGQQEISEELELSFLVHLDRSGRISAVEEIPTPHSTPRSTPRTRTSSAGSEKRRKSSSSTHSEKISDQETASKPKISLTLNDNGPINIQPPSYEDATKNMSGSKKDSSKQQEVSLHEEMRMETSLKTITTEIKERTEEEFIMGIREGIVERARKENRQLTEEEIAEMMAGEAEVLEGKTGKEVIGVNFQKFMPKCDFIKDSEVFKVLQEEQTKKETSEEKQLEKDPLKRFSKFLVKPNTTKPIPKPKPIHPEPMPWQQRLNSSNVPESVISNTAVASSEKTNEVRKASLKTEQESITTKTEAHVEKKEVQSYVMTSVQESNDNLTLTYEGRSQKEEYNEVTGIREDEIEGDGKVENGETEEELETINWKQVKKEKQKESEEKSSRRGSEEKSSLKRSSLSEEGRRSKNKKVAFVGLEFKADIEKQLAEIQNELLTLQRLPIEIQNHLLIVQRSLQDIVAQRSQTQSPVNGIESIKYNEISADDSEDCKKERVVNDNNSEENHKESDDKDILTIKEVNDSEVSSEEHVTIKNNVSVEECRTTTKSEIVAEETANKAVGDNTEKKESTIIKYDTEEESKKDLPHGQEGVEVCESACKVALPLTPQLRPLVLPGGRKWVQPRDAYTEEYIAETLISQSEVLVGTTIGVNFCKYIPPKFDTSNSAVYKYINEIEERTKKGVSERPEKVYGLDEFYHPPVSD
ncbi:uncharacterized protein LOC142330832 isoform X4 [Lycorma delicatula]|uniref:uncharacterized protein LOC142330832 isoform X4 n=1 Tax=Lycorma delicatula TaxID=130591 RepID=UPI003F51569F